jgi:site-specific DNA-adenine methylase
VRGAGPDAAGADLLRALAAGGNVAPFPYFGGKSRAAKLIWSRLGDVVNYVEPFAGSLAVLLARPHYPWAAGPRTETVNDRDGCVTNFWRAIQRDPERTAHWADNPVHELDLHARQIWLQARLLETRGIAGDVLKRASARGILPFSARCEQDPDFLDTRVAGWWAWGLCSRIGDNFASAALPHLGKGGSGVNRRLPRLGTGSRGECARRRDLLVAWFRALADRLRCVRVCCGDFERVLSPAVTWRNGMTAVLLDPPYAESAGLDAVYEHHGDEPSARARRWARANGDNPRLRIVLCGYEGEHEMPRAWECVSWKSEGGYGSQRRDKSNGNRFRERLWFSPACIKT